MQCTLTVCEPLGALVPGTSPLEGKSFYLDEVKSHLCGILTASIIRHGGTVESFLHKDVDVVITGNRDPVSASVRQDKGLKARSREQTESGTRATRCRGTSTAQICGSRGKALLERAIRNNEQSRGGVLSNAARYWGVKIVSVDQFLKVVDDLKSQCSAHTNCMREEGKSNECSSLRVIKAGRLKGDFVKVEDTSRKYRPLHGQSLEFPMLSYMRRFSPFESPAPVHPGNLMKDELIPDKFGKSEDLIISHEKPSASPKSSRRKKNPGFCECCQLKYRDQEQHLQSDVHQHFVEDVNNYSVVDRLVAAMKDVFSGCKELQLKESMMRLSSSCEGPLSESEQRCGSEMKPNQKEEPANRECVCDSPILHQEPCVDAPPSTSLEIQFLDEKQNHEPSVLSVLSVPCPLLKNNTVEPSSGAPAYGQKPCVQQELSEISLRTFAGLNDIVGSLSPKQHEAMQKFPPSWLPEREQILLTDTSSLSPTFQSLPCSLPTKRSAGVNPRKRSRSSTVSPRTSKVRRTNVRSDPTNQNSGVDVGFDPLYQSQVEGHTEVYELKLDVFAKPDPSPDAASTSMAASNDRLSFCNNRLKETDGQIYVKNRTRDTSSELGPPQLYPFFHDDVYQNQLFLDPPKLLPSVAPNTSVLSQSFSSSICLESALIPDTFPLSSSESDWDSGLLSRLVPPLHLQPKGGRCELDLGLLLQSSCSGIQDGNYASRLSSVLHPNVPSSHTAFGDPKTIYRPMETMDRRMVQSLEV